MADSLVKVIEELGAKDEDEILAILRANGITGRPEVTSMCILANYFAKVMGMPAKAYHIQLGYDAPPEREIHAKLSYDTPSPTCKRAQTVIYLPPVLARIAEKFDDKEYPDLIDPVVDPEENPEP